MTAKDYVGSLFKVADNSLLTVIHQYNTRMVDMCTWIFPLHS